MWSDPVFTSSRPAAGSAAPPKATIPTTQSMPNKANGNERLLMALLLAMKLSGKQYVSTTSRHHLAVPIKYVTDILLTRTTTNAAKTPESR